MFNFLKLTAKFTTSLILVFNLTAFSQTSNFPLQKKISEWQQFAGFKNAAIGLVVQDIGTTKNLVQLNPDLCIVPASILKLVTTATALEVFGPEFRFQTSLSYLGLIRNDTLFGDLIITGGGDPTLGSSYFPENNSFLKEWGQAVNHHSIRVICGKLIMDDRIYEPEMIPDTWVWEDIGNYYGAGASGISVYDNQYDIHLSSAPEAGKLTRIERIVPEIPGLAIQNKVLSSDANGDQTSVFGSPTENLRIIRGTIPVNQPDFVIHASMPDPKAILANEFRKELANFGISFSVPQNIQKESVIAPSPILISVKHSPTLKEIIQVTNYESVNLFAEHFLKHLAYKSTGLGSTTEGCRIITDFWKNKGIDISGFFLYDGSGLSRFNAITASQMVYLLTYMKTKSIFSDEFYQSMPGAGKGTLTVFKTDDFPNDCLHAKSGSMNRVRCYAGYLTTESGRHLSFAIMLNNFSCSQPESVKKIEELLAEMRKM